MNKLVPILVENSHPFENLSFRADNAFGLYPA